MNIHKRLSQSFHKLRVDFRVGCPRLPFVVVLVMGASCGFGQDTMILSSGSAAVGNSVSLDLTLGVASGSQPVSSVMASTVTSFSCTPSTVTTPGAATCTVGLSAPAPTGGTTVALGGGTTNASMPTSVSVAAGSTTAAFTASLTATANTTVVLTASLNGTSQTFTLKLAPPTSAVSLTGFSCNPTVPSMTLSLCTITLSAAAPSGGLGVAIQMTNPAPLRIPDSLLIRVGSSSATFYVKTINVTTSYQVTLQASLNGSSVTTVVTAKP